MTKKMSDIINKMIEFDDMAVDIWMFLRDKKVDIIFMERKGYHTSTYYSEIKFRLHLNEFKELVNFLNKIMREQKKIEKKLIEKD